MNSIIRIIPVLFIKNGHIVRSQNFFEHQVIGNVVNQCARYNSWNIDELIYIDISRKKKYDSLRDDHRIKSLKNIKEIVQEISNVCSAPLTFGGGIQTLDDMKVRMYNGADKIILNTLLFDNEKLVEKAAMTFGSQAIVASIDYKEVDKEIFFFKDHGKKKVRFKKKELLKYLENIGVGELFFHSISRDGKAKGFDIDFCEDLRDLTRLPIILCGGAGTEFDFVDVIKNTQINAVAAGNFFHFKELSYVNLKKILKKSGCNVRI